jgi:hypothetical protein
MRLRWIALALALAAAAPAGAHASQLIDRNATGVRLEVSRAGQALLTYRVHGTTRHVLAGNGLNAVAPGSGRRQVAFRLDYSGGWGTRRREVWKTFTNACRPYSGPPLAWYLTGCTAPDGSFWALQRWQRALPDYGLTPNADEAVWELRLSHWTGPLPVLTIHLDWAYRRYDHLFGSLTYLGQPVYGFNATAGGAPLDGFGRNIYVDTLDSTYGAGWLRENSFLSHRGTGTFCYGFYPHGDRPAGKGTRYRATAIGPGVTPDVTWEGAAPGPYDAAVDRRLADVLRSTLTGDPLCRPV